MDLGELIDATPWVDTHEHLVEEHRRLGPGPYRFTGTPTGAAFAIPGDWSLLIDSGYAINDLVCAGLSPAAAVELHASERSPLEKWDLVEPFMDAVRNTGYVRAIDLSTERLLGLRLSRETVEEIDDRLRALRYYAHVLNDVANVAQCQVHKLDEHLLCESRQPELLRQDLVLSPLVFGTYAEAERASRIEVGTLDDYVRVVEWAFERHAAQAVAVKCAWAYQRPLAVDPPATPPQREFARLRAGEADASEQRRVEDFLFQRCVDLATDAGLPIKLPPATSRASTRRRSGTSSAACATSSGSCRPTRRRRSC